MKLSLSTTKLVVGLTNSVQLELMYLLTKAREVDNIIVGEDRVTKSDKNKRRVYNKNMKILKDKGFIKVVNFKLDGKNSYPFLMANPNLFTPRDKDTADFMWQYT